jgi:hypothetical protein
MDGIALAIITRMRRPLLLLVLSMLFCARPSSGSSFSGAAVVREINRARQNPQQYASYLKAWRSHYRGDILVLPGRTMMRTHEGLAGLDEAIHFLQNLRPVAPLALSSGISRAAAEHVTDQATGRYGHRGSDQSDAGARMNRHGMWSTLWGENISYGKSDARDLVLALIVDDGLRGRKHRKNIFNAAYNYAGAAVGPHARYGTVCSIDFAGAYVEHSRPNDQLLARN